MDKMKVIGIKLTDDPSSTRVAYTKGANLYIRDGSDGFEVGRKAQAPFTALINKWGFRKVENPPEFRDAEELLDGLDKFSLANDGTVTYSGQ